MILRGRKGGYAIAEFRIPINDQTNQAIEDANLEQLPYNRKWNLFRLQLRNSDLEKNHDVIMHLIREAHRHYGGTG